MPYARRLGIALLAIGMLALSACEDAKTVAERKYQSSLELLQHGDPERAMVELRAALQLNGDHHEARLLYGELVRDNGNMKEAYGHFQLAAEQDPTDLRPRLEMAEMAYRGGDLDALRENLNAAVKVAPDNPVVKSIQLVIEMQAGSRTNDPDVIADLRNRAETLVQSDPALYMARGVLIDTLVRQNDYYGALSVIDDGLAIHPSDRRLHEFRLSLVEQLGDTEGIGAQLRAMTEKFPDVQEYKTKLIQWYLRNNDVESADSFMRSEVEKSGNADAQRTAYIQFLVQIKGPAAAISQIDQYIGEGTDKGDFGLLRASIRFDQGERDAAIADVRALIAGRASSDLVRKMQITLARMLTANGQTDEARKIVAQVLQEDPKEVSALKLQANWLIEDDRVVDAILALRTALDQAPYDADLQTLMAKAHEREGNRELMGENLAQAFQNSGAAANESLRYARFLMSSEKYPSARDVVLQALRRNPTDLQLLRILSEIYVGMADWTRADQVVKAMRSLGTEQAKALANSLEATVLQRLQRTDESVALLRGMLDDKSTTLIAQATIVRTHLATGDLAAARTFMDDMLKQSPDEPGTQFLNAALLTVEGNLDGAVSIYRDLTERSPKDEVIWRSYVAALARAGRMDESRIVLDQALQALPEAGNLLWVKAGYDEQTGNIDGAISIYRNLYERDSNSTIVANNLASLLATYRETPEDLEFANRIARRLKGTAIPAFQDTYGWIAYRTQNFDEAVDYLKKAAEGLPNDPSVQEHYAYALAAVQRRDQALEQFRKVLQMLSSDAGDRRNTIQKEIDTLETSSRPN